MKREQNKVKALEDNAQQQRHNLRFVVVNILPTMAGKKEKRIFAQSFKSSFQLAELAPHSSERAIHDLQQFPIYENTNVKFCIWSRLWLLNRSVCLDLLDALDKQKHSFGYLAPRYSTWFELNLIFCRVPITAQLGIRGCATSRENRTETESSPPLLSVYGLLLFQNIQGVGRKTQFLVVKISAWIEEL